MTTIAVAVDGAGALRAYVNSRTDRLVGAGKPLELGAWIGDGPRTTARPRSPYRGAYAVLSQAGGSVQALSQTPFALPRVSSSIYGVTALQATKAAVAYANLLFELSELAPVTVTWTPNDDAQQSVIIKSVDSITGPLEVADTGPEPRFLVDCVLVCTPAA